MSLLRDIDILYKANRAGVHHSAYHTWHDNAQTLKETQNLNVAAQRVNLHPEIRLPLLLAAVMQRNCRNGENSWKELNQAKLN